MEKNIVETDVVIIGAGPAGLTAGLYCQRAKFKTVLLEKFIPGGQVAISTVIENYPGFSNGIEGPKFVQELEKQVKKLNLDISSEEVMEIKKEQNQFLIFTNINKYITKVVIIAVGRTHRRLQLEKEQKFIGRGISYCATCDAPLFKDKKIIVVGGGDTALEETLYLTKYVQEIKLVHRRDKLRATKILQDRIFSNNKIEFVKNSIVTEIIGNDKLEGVKIKNVTTNDEQIINCDGIFVCVGFEPNTVFLKNLLWLDNDGYITTDENMQTSVKGVYACGDCRKKLLRQIVTACGDAAIAAFASQHYIENL